MHATDFLKDPAAAKVGPAAVLYGPEFFLKQQSLAALVRIVLGDDNELGLVRLAAETTDLPALMDTLSTVSMWTPRQIVLLEAADAFVSEHRAALERYLERPARKSLLVLDVKTWPSTTRLAKTIAASGLALECTSLKGPALQSWLAEMARSRHGKKLDRQAAALLVELAGMELTLLDQELAKLAAYVGDAPAIDAAAVEKLVGGWKARTTWDMLDAVRDGKVGLALELLDKLLISGEHPLKLLGGVNYVFRQAAEATELSRQGMRLEEALAQARVKPFAIRSMAAYLRRIGRRRAEQILDLLLQADLELKGGTETRLPDRLLVERLLVQLAGCDLPPEPARARGA